MTKREFQTADYIAEATKPSAFKFGDRVRIRYGVDRGHYGTIVSVGGDDGTYYGVTLDCHPRPAGYCEHELTAVDRDPKEIAPEYTEPPEDVKLSGRQETQSGPDTNLSGADV